jgi:hypothetical protein
MESLAPSRPPLVLALGALAGLPFGRWSTIHPGVVHAHRDIGSVGDYDICTAAEEIVGIAATGHTDDESESATPAGSYPGFGVRDDDAAQRRFIRALWPPCQ